MEVDFNADLNFRQEVSGDNGIIRAYEKLETLNPTAVLSFKVFLEYLANFIEGNVEAANPIWSRTSAGR